MGIGALAAAATVGAAVLMGQANAAKAAEIAVFATTSLRQALEKLGPQFERASGHKLNYQLGTSAPLKRQIDAGGPFDLAILVPASLDALIKEGKVQPETRVDVARSAIGVAVKAGSPKPETDTAEALRRTLLAAKSISYSGEGASGKYFTGLLERLGYIQALGATAVAAPISAFAQGRCMLTPGTPAKLADGCCGVLSASGADVQRSRAVRVSRLASGRQQKRTGE